MHWTGFVNHWRARLSDPVLQTALSARSRKIHAGFPGDTVEMALPFTDMVPAEGTASLRADTLDSRKLDLARLGTPGQRSINAGVQRGLH